MKNQADEDKIYIEFQVRDWVFVKLKPYRQITIPHKLHNKLSTCYYGPFKIHSKISFIAN